MSERHRTIAGVVRHMHGYKRGFHDPRDRLFSAHPTPAGRTPLAPAGTTRTIYSPPVRDQARIGSCHDAETEVLTSRGWAKFSECPADALLATVDPLTAALSYERPTRMVAIPFKGELVRCQQRFLDFAVTPDHKMLVRKWDQRRATLAETFQFVDAGDLGWLSGLLTRVRWAPRDASNEYVLPGVEHKHRPQREDAPIAMATWLRFLGIYLAEGTMLQEGPGHYKIQIAGSKERERAFIAETLAALDVQASPNLHDRFCFSNRRVYEAMTALGLLGVKAANKFVPAFVFEQPAAMLKEFLLGHFMGDGCADKNSGLRAHYTSSRILADDLQRLIFLSGDESYISMREPRTATMLDGRTVVGRHPEYRVSVCEHRNSNIDRAEHITNEAYDGMVYCAEVPTHHTLVTRRKGRILISGNCTANAGCSAAGFLYHRETNKPDPLFSRLDLYAMTRELEGTPLSEDSGCQVRDVFKAMARWGVCFEHTWPYVEARFSQQPPRKAMVEALNHKAIVYLRCATLHDIKQSIADGYPAIGGFTCFESLESDSTSQTGDVPMPSPGEGEIGGHCVLFVGYDDATRMLTFQNSWGTSWGKTGYGRLPYGYVEQGLADDFWTVRRETV